MSQLSPVKDILYCSFCRTKMSTVRYDSHSSLLFDFETVTFYCPNCKLAYVVLPGMDRIIITIVKRKEQDFKTFSSSLGLAEKEEE